MTGKKNGIFIVLILFITLVPNKYYKARIDTCVYNIL
ncbi:hypothetical protein EZS27_011856 [termite gut metagenome]|uniref:Uncharacterized protein n=1 Tax=termite gut metagenome TaxID=433724 RepID=A0A5J4S3D0_9ZZZZ